MNIVRLTTRIYPDKAGPAVYAYLLSEHISNKNFKMFNITCLLYTSPSPRDRS